MSVRLKYVQEKYQPDAQPRSEFRGISIGEQLGNPILHLNFIISLYTVEKCLPLCRTIFLQDYNRDFNYDSDRCL